MILLALLLACHSEFEPQADALHAWRDGRELLDEGRPAEAAAAFDRALRLDPGSAVLPVWKARALSQAGDPAGALASLETVPPSLISPEGLYNRAALRSRLDRDSEGFEDLARVVEAHPDWKARIREDPDFEGLAVADPSRFHRMVGEDPVRMQIQGEEGTILVGDPYDVRVQAEGPLGVRLAIAFNGPADLPFVPLRIEDDRLPAGTREHRSFTWSLRSLVSAGGSVVPSGGRGDLGPWSVTVTPLSGEPESVVVAAVPFQILAPQGMNLPDDEPEPLSAVPWSPRQMLEGHPPPAAFTEGNRLYVVHLPGDRIEVPESATLSPPLRIEIREAGDPKVLAVSWRWRPSATSARVAVIRSGSKVFDEDVLKAP